MKTYSFLVVIEEGGDEFWEEVTAGDKSGCDEVRTEILEALQDRGFVSRVSLHSYKDKISLA